MSLRTHAARPTTTAHAVSVRASMVMCSWSRTTASFATPATGTGFGTNGVYGTKRPARHLDEPLT